MNIHTEFILKHQELKGLSHAELSRRSGVALSTLTLWRLGKGKPSLTTFDKVLQALGVTYTLGAVDKHAKKDCFAYKTSGKEGKPECTALDQLYCCNGDCSFYKKED